jgi:predicted alpha-1,2-mannosidase
MQMEGEHYYPIDTTGWTVENTYRWSSPLLKPYFEWVHYHGETDIQSKRVAQDAISGISFLARNCGSRNNREQVVKDLIQQVRVDAMSSCLHNHDKPPEDKNLPWIQNKIKLLRAYKFHAAFENGNVRDYVTEKVYTALAAGTVPIYMGAPNIDEFVPKGSIIRVDSFEDTAALAKHIQECLTNETLYQSYHDWRDRPLNSEFVEKFAFTNVTTECRTCRWVYAHKHGLPWDKKSQTFEMPETKTEDPLPSLRHVDPFIGTATTGHTTPGAKAPFGMMYMVPVNSYDPMGSKWWEYTAGYQYSDKTFSGIAHTALTGTGIPGLLDVKISPFKKSRDKSNEIAHPGYYSATVDGVNIAVIAGNRFGIHRYTGTSHLFLKSKGCVSTNAKNTITGSCSAYFNEKWEKQKYPYSVHFYIELPSGCTYKQQTMTCPGKNIELKIAISYVDQNGAKANFKDENTDWDSLYKKTSAEWASTMDKIQVHGWHSEKQRKIFSSALYRTLLSPYTHNDADGRIRGPDGAIHTVDFTYYTFLSTWDTYRAWSSVIRLVRPDVLTDIAKTSVFHYKTMGIMPRWTVAGLDIQMMPGVPSMNVAFQAWRWGLTDSDLTKDIYEAMVGTLESKTKYKEGHLDAFVEKGVVPCGDKFQETVSQSLELGLNARCAAELAAHLYDSKESKWRNLSLAYRRHYDPDTKYLVGVNGANFCKPSSAYKVDANPELYTEGNAITWLWSAPFEGVKSLLGPELFKQRLRDLFTESVGAVSKRDYSGLIGAYAHGNEPTHHVPFWFKQNGDEATTNKYVHQILDTLYLDTPDGLPGNDDAGQISAWYVLATMGIYPVDPLAKEFQTHEPRVEYAVLNEPSGLRHTLTPTSTKEHHVVKYTIPDSLKPYVTTHPKGGLFVKTGDIPEMWIRDSVAQVWPYRDSHPGMIAEVLYRQSEFILHDVYANSYNLKWQMSDKLNRHMQTLGRGEWVGTRNYELDSGCYFLRLLYHAWKKHHLEIKTFRPSVELLVETWQVEQYHEEQSPYRYPELKRNGLGTPVKWTGMTWTGFRPSDDACQYGYHIPSNLFAAKALTYVSEMFPDIKEANVLRQDILTGVQQYGTWTDTDGKKRYCYEVDGLGGCNKMDDANVPSLLSIPYLDPEGYDRALWENTYEWIWSSKNPYFYKGTAAVGIGSPHTPSQYIWPMSLVMRGLVDPTVSKEMTDMIEKTKVRGKLHESFHKDDPRRLTREDFSWPNALYQDLRTEYITHIYNKSE